MTTHTNGHPGIKHAASRSEPLWIATYILHPQQLPEVLPALTRAYNAIAFVEWVRQVPHERVHTLVILSYRSPDERFLALEDILGAFTEEPHDDHA